jgi:LmbE family N-acetylglucosaminyl deacetylase
MVTAPAALLIVMAHPDDPELWAGGTIARHVEAGGHVTIAVAKHDPVRAAEAEAGARILGANLYLLDDVVPYAIDALLAEVRPDVLVTHSTNDIHPEHRRCAEHVLSALPNAVIATGHPRRVYHCDSYNNLDQHGRPLDLPTIVDVTEHWPKKMAALNAHASQPITDHFGIMAETLGRLHGQRIGVVYAEAFRALPVLGRLPAATGL